MRYFETSVKRAAECTSRDSVMYRRTGYSRNKLREEANLISKDISQLIDFVKENAKAACR